MSWFEVLKNKNEVVEYITNLAYKIKPESFVDEYGSEIFHYVDASMMNDGSNYRAFYDLVKEIGAKSAFDKTPKMKLAAEWGIDNAWEDYLNSKHDFKEQMSKPSEYDDYDIHGERHRRIEY